MRVWIGLGSNLGNRAGVIAAALLELNKHPGLRLLRYSSLYRTVPWGVHDQPEFCNAVAEFETTLDALKTLAVLQQVERLLGRIRTGSRWGPRKIDLDLLLFGEQIFILPHLVVPHPRIHRRAFVLEPLAEMQPDLLIPSRGTVASCLARLYREDGNRARHGVKNDGPIELPGVAGESLN